MTSWRDRVQPEEMQGQTRGGWGSFARTGSQEGGWGAFSREPKNPGPSIAMAVKAAEDSAAAKVVIAEKRKYEEAINLTSEKLYPSLGGSVPVAPKTTLDFKGVVKAVIAKEEEEAEAEDEGEDEVKANANAKAKSQVKTSVEAFIESFDDDDDDEEEEFNADIVQNRRRGDKGIW